MLSEIFNIDTIIGLSLFIILFAIDALRDWHRYHVDFDCDKCKDFTCPYHGCQKRKKNKRP